MKILSVNGTIMLHLEREEAVAVANILNPDSTDWTRNLVREKANPLFTEIVRQINICLKGN